MRSIIKTDPPKAKFTWYIVNCLEDCPFDRTCANHCTAGDFRTEGGFKPELTLENEKVICYTKNQSVDSSISYETLPENHRQLEMGAVQWKHLNELVNDYQI